MKRIHAVGALIASALVTAACNNTAPTAPAANTAAPATNAAAPAPAPAAPAPAGSATPTAGVTGAALQNFTVVNNTGHTVMTLNVSASNDDNWGPDILGADVITNGNTAEVSFERGEAQCLWDIRATYDDGDTSDLRGVNLCEVGTVTLNAS